MKVVYVIGPYRAETPYQIQKNIDRAKEEALRWWKNGWAVICPHMNTAQFDGEAKDSVWLEGAKEILSRCDAVVLIDGWENSTGSKVEKELAEALGIPVFYFSWPVPNPDDVKRRFPSEQPEPEETWSVYSGYFPRGHTEDTPDLFTDSETKFTSKDEAQMYASSLAQEVFKQWNRDGYAVVFTPTLSGYTVQTLGTPSKGEFRAYWVKRVHADGPSEDKPKGKWCVDVLPCGTSGYMKPRYAHTEQEAQALAEITAMELLRQTLYYSIDKNPVTRTIQINPKYDRVPTAYVVWYPV